MRKLLAVFCIALLSGCATVSLPSHPEPKSLAEVLSNVKGDTMIDLDAADAIAVAHGDVIAHACYPVLKKYVAPQTGQATVDQIKGVFSAFEEARVTRKAAEAKVGTVGVPDDLRLGCAALVQDERDFVIRLELLIAGSAAGVPGAANAVGAAGAALPRLIAPLLPR